MSRLSPSSHTIRPSLVRLALSILSAAAAILRGRWERELLRPLMQPDHLTRITREKFLAMTEILFRDEARLRREIFEAAMRMLGHSVAMSDADFVLPRPKTARGLWRRWGDYARMIAHAEWYAWRLARRLARWGCDACRLDQSTPERAAPDEGAPAAPPRAPFSQSRLARNLPRARSCAACLRHREFCALQATACGVAGACLTENFLTENV